MTEFFDSAFFDSDFFDNSVAPTKLGLFEKILKNKKGKTIGDYCFMAGCVEPGVDNANTALRNKLRRR